jgi:hypothetical protein
MQVYMFLLYLEYARLASPDRDTGKMVSRKPHSIAHVSADRIRISPWVRGISQPPQPQRKWRTD